MKSTISIVYVTRDAERASSMEQGENYAIVTNEKGETILDTYELLQTKRLDELKRKKGCHHSCFSKYGANRKTMRGKKMETPESSRGTLEKNRRKNFSGEMARRLGEISAVTQNTYGERRLV